MTQIKIEKGLEVQQELFQKYETLLPCELVDIWKNYGFGFGHFLQNLAEEYFLNKYFELPQFTEAVKKSGDVQHDECFGYVAIVRIRWQRNNRQFKESQNQRTYRNNNTDGRKNWYVNVDQTNGSMISGYMAAMKGYVAPEIESKMMREDRDDI